MPRTRFRAKEQRASYTLPRVLVDSCILIDVIDSDSDWVVWSRAKLGPLIEQQCAVINPIIFAEIAAGFASPQALEAGIAPLRLLREPLPWEAAFLASQAFQLYRKRRGAKRSPMPDFYIGAHAATAGYVLLTRDAARYKTYYPRLPLIVPE